MIADETLDVDRSIADHQADTTGRIVVEVMRCVRKELPKPQSSSLARFYQRPASIDLAKEVFKGENIHLAMMYVII